MSACKRTDLMHQCTAKSKRSGVRCNNPAMKDRDVCRMHGGKSLYGVSSPSLKSGRYSKHLPARLGTAYEDAANDPDLLSIRHDIALVDARLIDLISRVDSGESGSLWRSLLKAKEAYQDAPMKERADRLDDLLNLVSTGHSDAAAWNEVQQCLEQRRRLVVSETTRLMDMQQVITKERAMLMVANLVAIIKENVTDRDTLARISEQIRRSIE